ncbi:MAG: hypothetical protein WBE22_02825, partial [Halobacteriota archaeon]
MIDLLTFALVYAILKVCEGVSINLLSSTVFESIKDKIFKQKGKSEKELLKDAIRELKRSNIGADIQEEITKKEDKILSVSLEYYSELSKDTAEIKRLSELLNAKIDEMKAEQIEISKKTAELLEFVSGFGLKPTYKIFNRDLEGIKDVLGIRFSEGYVERPETDRLVICQNIRICGKPGIGKTTEIYRIIKRYNPELVVIITDAFTEPDVYRLLREDFGDNFLVVWDDFHDNPKLFKETIYKLRNEFDNFFVLCAARSTEKEKIKEEITLEFWEKANFTEKVDLHEFTREQCIELIRMCCEEFKVAASEDVILAIADKTLRSDGTPFYIVSVLIDYRDARIRMSDIESYPSDVVKVWKDKISSLSTNERTLLDCLKLLKMIHTPPYKAIVNEMYEELFGETKADLFGATESLERKIWLKEEDTYSSFDVQLEAVEIKSGMFNAFKQFVDRNELEEFYKSKLFFGMSYYYSQWIKRSKTKEELLNNLRRSIKYIEEATVIRRELGLKADVATSLNNSSNFYSDLAGLEVTKEARKEKLDIAIKYIEEAIGIYKGLGLKANVATSLNNASNFYSDLAGLEETKEARKEKLDIAIKYIEEAIGIRRELGLKANVATSLNNASNFYSDLAGLEVTKEARKEKLD